MFRRLSSAMCAAMLVFALGASTVLAGEVKGPPNQINNTNETGALEHANSACAASGLNDLDQSEGQTVSQVQTAADSWKYYGLPKGAPGTLASAVGGPARGNDRQQVRPAGRVGSVVVVSRRRPEKVRRLGHHTPSRQPASSATPTACTARR